MFCTFVLMVNNHGKVALPSQSQYCLEGDSWNPLEHEYLNRNISQTEWIGRGKKKKNTTRHWKKTFMINSIYWNNAPRRPPTIIKIKGTSPCFPVISSSTRDLRTRSTVQRQTKWELHITAHAGCSWASLINKNRLNRSCISSATMGVFRYGVGSLSMHGA